ncbi:MAG: hypothetical protein JWM78_779 [Verrucomicrobiaceae bacterium]|nr:hypothetical protein [Verrucomicrobiaceae bacterium]
MILSPPILLAGTSVAFIVVYNNVHYSAFQRKIDDNTLKGKAMQQSEIKKTDVSPKGARWKNSAVVVTTMAAAFCVGAALPASAEDAPGSAIHGFMDLSLKTDYITPRGLLVHDDGEALQVVNGLVVGITPDVSVVVGTWNDVNLNNQHDPNVEAWNEFDWFIGANWNVGNWALGLQYVEFISPPHNFTTEKNAELTVAYNDGTPGGTFAWKPYAKWFYAISGDSTVVLGKRGGTYDVELGLVPTWNVGDFIVTFPSWVTVGPDEYWGGDNGNVGVASLGVNVKYPLGIPQRFGKWYVDAGVQYYHLVNDSLVDVQTLTVGKSSGDRNLVLGSIGIGFGF